MIVTQNQRFCKISATSSICFLYLRGFIVKQVMQQSNLRSLASSLAFRTPLFRKKSNKTTHEKQKAKGNYVPLQAKS